MGSILHTGAPGAGEYVWTNTSVEETGDWNMRVWVRCNAGGYGQSGEKVPLCFGRFDGVNAWLFALDIGLSGQNTTLKALIYNAGSLDSDNILTGSDTRWVFCSCEHAAGSSDYVWRWRFLYETTFQTVTQNVGSQISAGGQWIFAFGSAHLFNEHIMDGNSRHVALDSRLYTDAQLLVASYIISPQTSSEHYFDADSTANAGDNLGTAAEEGTVVGTLTDDSAEPAEGTNAINFGVNF